MKQLPLVLALGSAFLSSMAAAQSSVQVYGRLYPYINQREGIWRHGGRYACRDIRGHAHHAEHHAGGVTGMASGNSNIGFSGKEDLGDGV